MREGQGIDRTKFAAEHERIFGHARPKLRSGRYVMQDGELVPVELAGPSKARKRDSKHIVSENSGVHPKQAKEMNQRFGHLGVKYDETTGYAHYQDRNAKLRVLKARGYHDMNETRG